MAVANAPDTAVAPRLRSLVAGPLTISMLTSAAIVALNMLTGVLLARALGPHARGELAAVYLWPLIFATLGGLGIADATTFHVARSRVGIGRIVGTSCVLAFALAVALAAAAAAVIPLVLGDYGADARNAAFLFLLYVPMNLVTLSLLGVLNGLHRFSSFNAVRLLLIAVTAVGMVAVAVAGDLTVTTAIAVYLLAGAAWTLGAAAAVRRAGVGRLSFDRAAARSLLGYGVRSHPGAVSGMLNEFLDKLVISVVLGPTKLGLYVIAVTLTGVTDFVGSSVGMVALPAVAKHERGAERAAAARRFVGITVVVSALVTVPIVLFTPQLITLFFGAEYRDAATVARVLLVAGVVLSTTRALGAVLRAVDRPLDASRGQLAALVVTAVALAALLPAMGLLGAGIASLLAYAVSMLVLVRRAARELGLPARLLLLPDARDMSPGVLASLLRRDRGDASARMDAAGSDLGQTPASAAHLRPQRVLWIAIPAGAVAASGAAAAAATGSRHALLAAGAVLFLAALAVGLVNWRWSVIGLVAYVPFSGVPIIALYSDRTARGAATLAEDLLFVIPAYVGFALWHVARRRRPDLGRLPLTLVLVLAVIVLAQCLNPALPNRLVAAIGVKVWLFYVPLAAVAYAFVRTRRELFSLLGLMSLLALVPAGIGFVEALLVYSDHASVVYRAYGSAAAAATQEFVKFTTLGGLRRLPSTFSFSVQFYTYMSAMLVVAYAWWRGARSGRRHAAVGAIVWLAALAGTFVSGQRGAFVFVPLLVGLLVVLPGRVTVRTVALPAAALVLTVPALAAAGVSPQNVAVNLEETVRQEFQDAVVNGVRDSAGTTVAGLGTGIDTAASRYAFERDEVFTAVKGKWHEGWYVKAYLELGLVGFLVVVALLLTIVVRGFQIHFRVRDPGLRVVSGSLLAFLLWCLVYNLKGQYVDLDPLNVFFWLFVGILFKLPALERDAEPETT